MNVKPSRGLRARVNATKEAVFGEEGVEIKKMQPQTADNGIGILTGRTLAGYCEVEMPTLDGKKHWYPIDQLMSENGDKIVEEEIEIDMPSMDDEEE
jgi:hypothetical protein